MMRSRYKPNYSMICYVILIIILFRLVSEYYGIINHYIKLQPFNLLDPDLLTIVHDNVTINDIFHSANIFPVYNMSQDIVNSMFEYINQSDMKYDDKLLCCTLVEATVNGFDDLTSKLMRSSSSVRRRCHWAILIYGGEINML